MIIGNALRMLPAISLNDQAMLLADEVHDKWSNRLLSAEFGAFHLAIAKHGPKLSLGVGQFAPQVLGCR